MLFQNCTFYKNTDRKLPFDPNTDLTVDYSIADVKTYSDYYPYGMQLPYRKGSDGETYRFGYNGMEKDDELKGAGNSVNFEYRMHDPRLGRFFAVDPLAYGYPHNSPYAFSENILINAVELEGLEKIYVYEVYHDENGNFTGISEKLVKVYTNNDLKVDINRYNLICGVK